MKRKDLVLFGSAALMFDGALLTAFANAAVNADPQDIASLNVAIELENAAIAAYAGARASGLLSPAVAELTNRFSADHTAHRDALVGAVQSSGATATTHAAAITAPKLASERDIIAFANTVEMRAAATYLSVVPELKDRRFAGFAAAILGVETTHVALLSEALGVRTYPTGFVV